LERLHSELAGLGIDHLARTLTDNGTEYKGRPSHALPALCARLGSEHRHTKVRHAWTKGVAAYCTFSLRLSAGMAQGRDRGRPVPVGVGTVGGRPVHSFPVSWSGSHSASA
jgi:hypothetical protein